MRPPRPSRPRPNRPRRRSNRTQPRGSRRQTVASRSRWSARFGAAIWWSLPTARTPQVASSAPRGHLLVGRPQPEPDPVIYLEGGPGGDALETVPLPRTASGLTWQTATWSCSTSAGQATPSPRSPAPKRGSSTSSCSTMCSPRGVRCPPDRGGRSLPRPAPGRGHRPEPVRLGFVVGGRRRPGTSPRLRPVEPVRHLLRNEAGAGGRA